jgi:hypothetical protein
MPYLLVAFIAFIVAWGISTAVRGRRKPDRQESLRSRIIGWHATVGATTFVLCSYGIPDWHITSPWPAICCGAGLVCAGLAGWHAAHRRWGRLTVALGGVLVAALNFAMAAGNALG